MELNAEGATVDLRCADLDQLGERFVQARIGYCFSDCSQGCYYGRRCPGEVCVFHACLHPMRSPRWVYLFKASRLRIDAKRCRHSSLGKCHAMRYTQRLLL